MINGTFAEYMATVDPTRILKAKDTIKIQRHWAYLHAKHEYELSFLKYTVQQKLRKKTRHLKIENKIQDGNVGGENVSLPLPSPPILPPAPSRPH